MKTYVVKKNLPDAEVGTLVEWNENAECYYYMRSPADPKINNATYLTQEQVYNGAEFFVEYDKYPEYYGYENPVLSRKDVLDLFNDIFQIKDDTSLYDLRKNMYQFKLKLSDLAYEKGKEIIENQDNPSQIKDITNKSTFEIRTELSDALKILQQHLRKDGEYKQGWVANIAMGMYDEFTNESGNIIVHKDNLHTFCNRGAERFIELLIKE